MIMCVIELLKSFICVKESVIYKFIYLLKNEEFLVMYINYFSECVVLVFKVNFFFD